MRVMSKEWQFSAGSNKLAFAQAFTGPAARRPGGRRATGPEQDQVTTFAATTHDRRTLVSGRRIRLGALVHRSSR